MSNPASELFIIFLLLVANGAFAMAEIAIVSVRKARLQQLAEAGHLQARVALDLATDPNQFLATAQIGITLVGILTGAFGGATIAEGIALRLNAIPGLSPYAESIGVGIVVLGLTYFSLIIGELVPKRLALNNNERIAMAVAVPMRALSRLASPVVRLLSVSTDVIIRLLGVKPSTEPAITPEEIRVLIEQGTASGVFAASEQDMIESVLRLDQRRVAAVMTPRQQVIWFDVADTPEDLQRKMGSNAHSRFPVVQHDPDNVLGIVRAKDLLNQRLAAQPFDLAALARPALFIPESMSTLQALELFKQQGTHLALVMDEYGSIQGLVTHHDILEAIVGDIPTADAPAQPEAIRREDGSWLLDGLASIDRLKKTFDIEKLPDEDQAHYQTVGGFVMTLAGRIPAVGQVVAWNNLRFEVVDMDGRRIDKVLVTFDPIEQDSHP